MTMYLRGGSNQSMKNYGFICNAIFKTCTYAHLYGWNANEP